MIQAQPADQIVITASRVPQDQSESAASSIVIDASRTGRVGEPLVPSLLRLVPSTAVSVGGPAGSLTQVRIRGSEANHTLLFVDGIRINDPARGNQPPFELLNADIASRIEVVRGPQSALWGSEAIGGVVAINGVDDARSGVAGSAEAGSFGFRRAAVSAGSGPFAGALGWQRARGIDSFDGSGDRDGYRNLSARVRGSWRLSPGIKLSGAALRLAGRSEFDGYDTSFAHADTLDSNRNRLAAGRVGLKFGQEPSPWSGQISATLLGSVNRNLLAGEEINRTQGRRWTVAGQAEHRFSTAGIAHQIIAAVDHEQEEFEARDTIYGGSTTQDRDRAHQSLTLEWRADAGRLHGDVAVRRDLFNRFADATTLRASLLADLGGGLALAGSYAEGIAQPTFFDLYGFSPQFFVGNPLLEPESSRGLELSIRYRGRAITGALTLYRQRLHDEIIDTFDFDTFLSSAANRSENSRRSGVEAEFGWAIPRLGRLSLTYAYLDASQPDVIGTSQIREARRPKHSGSAAFDGYRGRLSYGLALSHTGAQYDQRDVFPYDRVRLRSYWLAGARLAYDAGHGVELFARTANLFDADYQDAFGYRTEGRSLNAGIRVAARP